MIDQSSLENYDINWSDVGHESNIITNLFDNFFGWVNDNLEGKYSTLDEQRKIMLKDNPDLDIKALDDGFQLEAERLNAIRQRQSRGFTIIDINPGLATAQNYPLSLPYEFLFDGTNFMPTANDSIAANFRTVPIDIAGNFVKIEYIYENNSNANDFNALTGHTRPAAVRKYAQSLLNPDTADLYTGYTSYDFDNAARNKVFIGFNDTISKPHIITRSGDAFNTYFNSLVLHFNIGCPKIRVTIGFNSEKVDGHSDAPINSKLHLMGAARLFKDFDSPLVPFNLTNGDLSSPYTILGYDYAAVAAQQSTSVRLIFNNSKFTNIGTDDLGYSVLFITNIDLAFAKDNVNRAFITVNLRVGPLSSPSGNTNVRVFSMSTSLYSSAGAEIKDYNFRPESPIRVVIPTNQSLWLDVYYQSNANTTVNLRYSVTGYSLGVLRKIINPLGTTTILTSKFITDSTFLTDFNRVEAIKDN